MKGSDGMVLFRYVTITAVCLPLLFCACRRETPPGPNGSNLFDLSAEDASCTEAWLHISLDSSVQPRTLTLKRDGQTVSDFRLLTSDTLLVDEGLLPNHTYNYTIIRPTGSGTNDFRIATVITMDTTGHDFVWQIDTLGVTASTLYDVAIVSDSNVWAVGELYLNDSSGQLDPILYNAAHWDGTRWNIIRIPYIYQGSLSYSSIKCLFAFGENDIWFSNSVHWNGQQFYNVNLAISIFTGIGINKMWGNPLTGELYVVGNNGTIAYSPDRGSTWQRVESGTTLSIWDVYGERDDRTGKYEIICVASNHSFPEGRKLLRIQGPSATSLPDSGLPWSIDAIWHVPGRKYIVVGDSVWQVNQLGTVWKSIRGLPNLYTTSIAGSAFNDIIIGGAFWNLLHFNGLTWRAYFPFASGSFASVTLKGRTIIAIGGVGNRAVAIRGTR